MSSRVPSLAVVLALFLLLAAPARAEDESGLSAKDLVQLLLTTADRDEQQKIVADIVDLAPDPDEVAGWLAEGRTYAADVPTGWLERKNLCTDGVERNFLLYVPEDYSPEKRYRLVVDMHGGVSRPQMLTHAELGQMKFFWGEHAKANGYLLALPAGQRGAEWWSPVGARHVLDVIRTVKREYDVDENRVFGTGFSDGASGSFYLALTHSTPFAGFIPLNGHLAVTQSQGLQVHLLNLRNRRHYVVNTERDSLYPAASVGPIVSALAPLGVDVTWHAIPRMTHNPMYMATERPVIAAWMDETKRDPHPKRVVWQGTADAPHRVDWLDGVVVGPHGDAVLPDPNPELPPGRVRIGVNIDQAHPGEGVKVSAVSEDTPAAEMGIEAGDVIVGLDDADIAGFRDLRQALSRKAWGDAFVLILLRGEERLTLEGAFPAASPQPVFRRTAPWGAVAAEVAGNVIEIQAQGIDRFDVYLAQEMLDLDAPVKVEVNGVLVHDAMVTTDLGFMLSQAAEDEDRTRVYRARLRIEVPRPR